MFFFFRLIRALRLRGKMKKYIKAKKLAQDDEEKPGLAVRFNLWWLRTCPVWLGGFKESVVDRTALSPLGKFKLKIGTYGTYENYVAKSIIGFMSGVFLTYLFFAFFVLQLNFSLASATLLCSIFGMVLTLGLAFSYKVRCVVLMLLPQFFSKRGRQALVAYAFILVLTGPAKNTLHNTRVLSETMACGQGKLKQAVKAVVDLIKKPFYAIRDSIKQIIEKVKEVVKKVKGMLAAIKKTLLSILGVIKNAFEWLNSVVNVCSKKLGTPFQRCMNVFDDAIVDCKARLGPMFNWMCSVAYVASHLCYAVKFIDYICELFEFVSDEIIFKVKRKLREFSYQVRNIFYVSIEFNHSFGFETEQSKNIRDIAAGIMMEIREKTESIISVFDWMSFAFSFFFLNMLFQVLNYKRRFLTNDWYDNHFITDNIVHLDIRRTYMGKETILPLNVHERKKYIEISSIRLVATEKSKIAKSAIFLGLSTVKLSIHMLTDYSLWWILKMIRFHGQFAAHIDEPPHIEVQVAGKGVLSELFASIIKAFQPSGLNLDLDTSNCLPDPTPPNIARYKQIISLMAVAWLLSFSEPYGLRLRHAVMAYYYPARARARAVWLYNHILRSRGSFLKYARRQLRREFVKGNEGVEKVKFMDRLRASFPILRKICKGKVFVACLLCGTLGSESKPLVKCPRAGCTGVYCVDCFAQLQNLCTLCLLPMDYGDLSDVSEERDSSEEEFLQQKEVRSDVEPDSSSTDRDEASGAPLLTDSETESELSFDYQYRERTPADEPPPQASLHRSDPEAQRPAERTSLDEFLQPLKEDEAVDYSMTLSERKKSGVWSLFSNDNRRKASLSLDPERGESENVLTQRKKSKPLLRNVDETKSEFESSSESESMEEESVDLLWEEDEEYKTRSSSFASGPLKRSDRNRQESVEMKPMRLSIAPEDLQGVSLRTMRRSNSSESGDKIDLLSMKISKNSEEKSFGSDRGRSESKTGPERRRSSEKVQKSADMVENWVHTGTLHKLDPISLPNDEVAIPLQESRKESSGIKQLFNKMWPRRSSLKEVPEEVTREKETEEKYEREKQESEKDKYENENREREKYENEKREREKSEREKRTSKSQRSWFSWIGSKKKVETSDSEMSGNEVHSSSYEPESATEEEDVRARLSYQGADNFGSSESRRVSFREDPRSEERAGQSFVNIPLVSFRGSQREQKDLPAEGPPIRHETPKRLSGQRSSFLQQPKRPSVQFSSFFQKPKRLSAEGSSYLQGPKRPSVQPSSFMTMRHTPSAAKIAHDLFKLSDEEANRQ